jgi:hypothetical protein
LKKHEKKHGKSECLEILGCSGDISYLPIVFLKKIGHPTERTKVQPRKVGLAAMIRMGMD